jgi:hypothetical protein
MAGRGPVRDPSKPFSRANRTPERRSVGLVVLPAEGNPVDPPPMPAGQWTDAERATWDDVWSSPQSTQYDLSATGVVSLYVRALHQCLNGRTSATLAAEVRQLAEQLGLTPQGMHRLGWVIAEPADMAPVVALPTEAK